MSIQEYTEYVTCIWIIIILQFFFLSTEVIMMQMTDGP